MSQEFYSLEQVAELLGLHVRTVRAYVREGRLKAQRIGKQYRVLRGDLDALTGGVPAVRRVRHIEVSSVVLIDAVDTDTAYRLTTLLTSALNAQRDGDAPARLETVYDAERARLKIIISAGAETTGRILMMIPAVASTS